MKLADMISGLLRPLLKRVRPVCHAFASSVGYRKIVNRPKSRNELHQYWREPQDGSNLPHNYLEGKIRSQFLVEIVKRYAPSNVRILEIGCNVGRNLNYLFLAGFKALYGIEISKKAVQLLKHSYTEMASHTKIYINPVEEIIRDFEDNKFDIVFTMAVLEHIHRDSEWIFSEIVRITRNFLITIEDEQHISQRHFPRNYKKVFESLGMEQIEEIKCTNVKGLGSNFSARIFRKISY